MRKRRTRIPPLALDILLLLWSLFLAGAGMYGLAWGLAQVINAVKNIRT